MTREKGTNGASTYTLAHFSIPCDGLECPLPWLKKVDSFMSFSMELLRRTKFNRMPTKISIVLLWPEHFEHALSCLGKKSKYNIYFLCAKAALGSYVCSNDFQDCK